MSEHMIREALVEKPHILVVCTGNICRSPMGEVVLRAKIEEAVSAREVCDEEADFLAGISVGSSGVSSEEEGEPIYPPAAQVLREYGYSVPVRRAHKVTAVELRNAGLILAMTVGHARRLRPMCEAAGVSLTRLHLWREFDGTVDIAPQGCFGSGGALEPKDGMGVRGKMEWGGRSEVSPGMTYSDFYSSDGKWDVPDPWYTGDFLATIEVVEAGARGVLAALS